MHILYIKPGKPHFGLLLAQKLQNKFFSQKSRLSQFYADRLL